MPPSLRGTGASSRPAVAIWVYQNGSLVVAYVDFQLVALERIIDVHRALSRRMPLGLVLWLSR